MLVTVVEIPADLSTFKVCRDCAKIYGRWTQKKSTPKREAGTSYTQTCSCGKPDGDKRQSPTKWPGFDYNQYATLCYCCGLVPLPSGSKWSCCFCKGCRDNVGDLNKSFGSAVIPIGRHSLMNSVFSKSNKNPDPKAIQKFADDVGGLINRSGSLSEWAKKIVIRNVAFIESSEVDPALSYYVAGTQWFAEANVDWSRVHDWAPVSKLDAFLEMCDFLKIGKIGD